MVDLHERLARIEEKVDHLIGHAEHLRDVQYYIERQKGTVSAFKWLLGFLVGAVTAIGTAVAALYTKS